MRMNPHNHDSLLLRIWAAVVAIHFVDSLTIRSNFDCGFQNSRTANKSKICEELHGHRNQILIENEDNVHGVLSRRKMATKSVALVSGAVFTSAFGFPKLSGAEVGSLPEFADTNAIINGLTINVADASQQQSMIDFLIGAFSFEVQRQRIQGSVEETVSI